MTEFAYDWCRSALELQKNTARTLAGTRWLFSGSDPLQDAVRGFLEFADRELSLGLSLSVLPEEGSAPAEADFCVCFTTTPVGSQRAPAFWQRVKAVCRAICVSGWGYGDYANQMAASEEEFRRGYGAPEVCGVREGELAAGKYQSDVVILRPGVILAPGLELSSPVSELLDQLLRQDTPCRVPSARYTLTYITDFLSAFLLAAARPDFSGAYNVGAPETTVSLLRVCDLFSEAGEPLPPLEPVRSQSGYALSCGKLLSAGWSPSVDLKTMLSLELMARKGQEGDLWLPGGHDGKLELIHAQLLRILEEIDRICKKHDIRYFLAGGTLLGAVRHGGFIPWDDDLDIMMLREDHDRFLAVAPSELPEHLFLQTPATDPGCHYLISKVRLSGTVFSSKLLCRFPQLHKGLFVDIIAQDYTANGPLGQKLHRKLALLARGLVYKKWSGEAAASVKRGYAVFDLLKRLLPMSALERFQRWALTLLNRKPGRNYLFDSMGINIDRGAYPARWLEEQTQLPFGGGMYPAPGDYHGYLTYLYGDYMQPVPLTQRRIVHTVPQLDLGEWTETEETVGARQY